MARGQVSVAGSHNRTEFTIDCWWLNWTTLHTHTAQLRNRPNWQWRTRAFYRPRGFRYWAYKSFRQAMARRSSQDMPTRVRWSCERRGDYQSNFSNSPKIWLIITRKMFDGCETRYVHMERQQVSIFQLRHVERSRPRVSFYFYGVLYVWYILKYKKKYHEWRIYLFDFSEIIPRKSSYIGYVIQKR